MKSINFYPHLLLTSKKYKKQKMFLILKITGKSFNIKSNRLIEIKTI